MHPLKSKKVEIFLEIKNRLSNVESGRLIWILLNVLSSVDLDWINLLNLIEVKKVIALFTSTTESLLDILFST